MDPNGGDRTERRGGGRSRPRREHRGWESHQGTRGRSSLRDVRATTVGALYVGGGPFFNSQRERIHCAGGTPRASRDLYYSASSLWMDGSIEGMSSEQDRSRHDLQARTSRREKLASPPRPQPVAESHPRCKVQPRNRGRQIASSSRCRLTPVVTKIQR
jgi:hypothetical protein